MMASHTDQTEKGNGLLASDTVCIPVNHVYLIEMMPEKHKCFCNMYVAKLKFRQFASLAII